MSEVSGNETITNTGAAKNPSLNIADLANVLQLIRTCASRGAFQAEEMSSVGSLYDRLHAFLASTGAIKLDDTKDETTSSST